MRQNRRLVSVRLPVDMHKEFTKKLIDDEMSAQEFFFKQVEKYLEKEAVKSD